MKIKSISDFLINNGFKSNGESDFFKENDEFIKCVNIQRKSSGDVFFINLGVNPIFNGYGDENPPRKEIDCYIRHRISSGNELDAFPLNTGDDVDAAINKVKNEAWPFFDFFSSLDNVFGSIKVKDLEEGTIPKELQSMPRARLALMCMRYFSATKNTTQAYDFAKYGLSVAGMAVGLKKEFKSIIKEVE